LNNKLSKDGGHEEEIRCSHCDKLLAKGVDGINVYEIKCNRCGIMNSIFRDIQDQIIITNIDGKILYANHLVEEITGYKLSEIIGKNPSLWGNQMPKEFYKQMWHTIKVEGKTIDVTLNNRKKNGKIYKARLRISPIFDSNGKIEFFVGMESIVKNKNELRTNTRK
jgi:PAS domain S-box-containing protein